jgi:hypothetical protein
MIAICEICQRRRFVWWLARPNGEVHMRGQLVLNAAQHTVCSDACANILYFCAIYSIPITGYVWLL